MRVDNACQTVCTATASDNCDDSTCVVGAANTPNIINTDNAYVNRIIEL